MLNIVYLIAGAVALGGCVAGAALAHFGVVPPMAGFGMFALGLLLGAVVTLIGVVVIIRGASPMSWAAIALGVGPCVILIAGIVSSSRYPSIHDISTELIYPPEFENALTLAGNEDEDFSFPEANKAIIEERYPEVERLALEGEPTEVFMRISDLAREQPGWTVTTTTMSADENVLEGYATSSLFKFVDDFVIRVTNADEGSVVDMRSRSREGQNDFGANAKRIQSFLGLLE